MKIDPTVAFTSANKTLGCPKSVQIEDTLDSTRHDRVRNTTLSYWPH